MDRLIMVPFLVGGVLIIIYRYRLAEAFNASNRAFYGNLLGEDRARRLDAKSGSRWHRFNQAWGPWFLLFFGLALVAIGLLALIGPLVGIGEWEGL
jgi:hypothetical protein